MKNSNLKLALNFSKITGIPINKLVELEKTYNSRGYDVVGN